MEQDQLRGWVGQLPQDEVFRELLIAQADSNSKLEKVKREVLDIKKLVLFIATCFCVTGILIFIMTLILLFKSGI